MPEQRRYEWRVFPDCGQAALYHGRKQIGNWNHEQHGYFRLETINGQDTWTKDELPLGVVAPPATSVKVGESVKVSESKEETEFLAMDDTKNFGLDESKIAPNVTTLNGRQVAKPEAFEALAGGSKDFADSKLPFVVATLRTDLDRKKFLSDWERNPAYQAFRDRVRLQAFSTGDKQLLDRDGKPTWYAEPGIRIVEPDGKANIPEISRGSFDAGVLGPRLVAAIKKVDPNWKPPADDEKKKPVAPDDGSADEKPVGAIMLFLGIVCTGVLAIIKRGLS